MTTARIPLDERIRRMSSEDERGCWVWTGRPNNRGYGQLGVLLDAPRRPRTMLAHRVSYMAFVGPIPDGLVIDHLCRNRLCVNPAHLEVVTQRENSLRSPVSLAAINAAKTHCPRGHEYDRESLHRNGTTRLRRCSECARRASARSMHIPTEATS